MFPHNAVLSNLGGHDGQCLERQRRHRREHNERPQRAIIRGLGRERVCMHKSSKGGPLNRAPAQRSARKKAPPRAESSSNPAQADPHLARRGGGVVSERALASKVRLLVQQLGTLQSLRGTDLLGLMEGAVLHIVGGVGQHVGQDLGASETKSAGPSREDDT